EITVDYAHTQPTQRYSMLLSEEQKAAVEAEGDFISIIAGAGSGKTRVLVERLAHLIENQGVDPSLIYVFTFTRKAAAELEERIEKRTGEAVTCGTFHSI